MIELVYANRTENLLDALAADLKARRAAGAHPLDPTHLVVPNANMETWVRFGLAQALGVAAGLKFQRLERFVGELVAAADLGLRLVDLDVVEAAILDVLLDEEALAEDVLADVRRYLAGSGAGRHGDGGADLRWV
jgi:exodeoxyribonuclease V gamma subunit